MVIGPIRETHRVMSAASLVAEKAQAALRVAGGQRVKAQRLLLQWATQDRALLAALAAPYLAGLAAQAVEQAAQPTAQTSGTARNLSADAFDHLVGALGDRIGTSREPSGMSALISPPHRPQAGEQHVQTLRALAKAHAAKRFDPPTGSR